MSIEFHSWWETWWSAHPQTAPSQERIFEAGRSTLRAEVEEAQHEVRRLTKRLLAQQVKIAGQDVEIKRLRRLCRRLEWVRAESRHSVKGPVTENLRPHTTEKKG